MKKNNIFISKTSVLVEEEHVQKQKRKIIWTEETSSLSSYLPGVLALYIWFSVISQDPFFYSEIFV